MASGLAALHPLDAIAGGVSGLIGLVAWAVPDRSGRVVIGAASVATSVALVATDEAEPWLVFVVTAVCAASFVSWRAVQWTAIGGACGCLALLPVEMSTGLRVASGVVLACAAFGLWQLARKASRATTAALVVLSGAGVFAAVPDTEAPLIVLVATAVTAVAALPRRSEPLTDVGPALWAAPVVLVCWGAIWGARGDLASLPGGLACLGVILVSGLVVVVPRGALPNSTWLVGLQAAAVAAASRWATRGETVTAGAVRAAGVIVVVAVLVVLSALRRAPRGQVL